jgi:hypothetical protein
LRHPSLPDASVGVGRPEKADPSAAFSEVSDAKSADVGVSVIAPTDGEPFVALLTSSSAVRTETPSEYFGVATEIPLEVTVRS